MNVTKLIETCKVYISRECVVYQIVENPSPIFDTNFLNIIKGDFGRKMLNWALFFVSKYKGWFTKTLLLL